MAMRFRKLKTFAKEAVDVYRSKIHGRGLFCKRNIDAGEMVIEYAGEVIRASLTDKREKYYEGKVRKIWKNREWSPLVFLSMPVFQYGSLKINKHFIDSLSLSVTKVALATCLILSN